MEQGDTHLVGEFNANQFRNFLLFPLPADDAEYSGYMVRVRALFPKNALRTVTSGGREFTFGPIGDLALLFPLAASHVCPAKDVACIPVPSRLQPDGSKKSSTIISR